MPDSSFNPDFDRASPPADAQKPVPELRLSQVLVYLDDCNARLLTELELARDSLHRRPSRGWSVAQIVHHLIRCEKIMMPIWEVVPTLGRWPRLLTMLDRANTVLWRALGMKVLEAADGPITSATAVGGRFRTPVFLDPRPRKFDYDRLIEWRRTVRMHTLRAVQRLDEETLNRATWSLPHSGKYSLLELVRFIGIHEMHHLPQIRRLRELWKAEKYS